MTTTEKTAKKKIYADNQHILTGAALLAGSREFPALEIPEIPINGEPGIVFIKPLSAGDVLKFTAAQEVRKLAKAAGEEVPAVDDGMFEMIQKSVCTHSGEPMFTPGQSSDLQNIDIRVFARLSRAITNMIDGKDLDYEEPVVKPEAAKGKDEGSDKQ